MIHLERQPLINYKFSELTVSWKSQDLGIILNQFDYYT